MISDQNSLKDLQSAWKTVISTLDQVKLGSFAGFIQMHQSHKYKNIASSLLILFAFSVLEETLLQLRDEEKFACKSSKLGDLMKASQKAIPWLDYNLVDKGRERRNDIAHRRQWIERTDCWKFLEAIEAELKHWQIVCDS